MKPLFMILALSSTLAACGSMPPELGANGGATAHHLDVSAGCPSGAVAQLDPSSGKVVCTQGDIIWYPDEGAAVLPGDYCTLATVCDANLENCQSMCVEYDPQEAPTTAGTQDVASKCPQGTKPYVTAEGELLCITALEPEHKGTTQTDTTGGSGG